MKIKIELTMPSINYVEGIENVPQFQPINTLVVEIEIDINEDDNNYGKTVDHIVYAAKYCYKAKSAKIVL